MLVVDELISTQIRMLEKQVPLMQEYPKFDELILEEVNQKREKNL